MSRHARFERGRPAERCLQRRTARLIKEGPLTGRHGRALLRREVWRLEIRLLVAEERVLRFFHGPELLRLSQDLLMHCIDLTVDRIVRVGHKSKNVGRKLLVPLVASV